MYVKGLSPGERDLSYIQTIIANISFISDAIRPIEIKSLAHRKNLIYATFLCVNNSQAKLKKIIFLENYWVFNICNIYVIRKLH